MGSGERRAEVNFGEGEGVGQRRHFQDPSEPIYTEPSLFERSRSLRSMATDFRRVVHPTEPSELHRTQPTEEAIGSNCDDTQRAVL